MNSNLRLFLILFPLALAPACDDSEKDDDEASTSSDKGDEKKDDDDDSDNEVPLWDCFCEAECDGDVLEYSEEVCSDASTLDLAIDIAVDECAFELEGSCIEFDCYCDCEEDPDLACG